MKQYHISVCASLMSLAGVSGAQQVAYSSFGFDYNYESNGGWLVEQDGNYQVAGQFQASVSGQISDVIVPLNSAFGDPGDVSNIVQLQLFADNGANQMSGSAIYTTENGSIGNGTGSWSPPQFVPFTNGPTIYAGSMYWLVASIQTVGYAAVWGKNNNANYQNSNYALASGGGAWQYYNGDGPAFEVDVTPEPITLPLLGFASLVLFKRRRAPSQRPR